MKHGPGDEKCLEHNMISLYENAWTGPSWRHLHYSTNPLRSERIVFVVIFPGRVLKTI